VTFRDALNALLTLNVSKRKKEGYRYALSKLVKLLNVSWKDNVEIMEYEVVEKFVHDIRNKFAPSTIQSILGTLYLSGNVKLRTYYKSRGMKRPVFERFVVKSKRTPHESMSWEQKTAIDYKMETLRRMALDNTLCERKRSTARNQFIAFWWGKHYGTRPGDINTIKWDNITYINGIPHVRWIPNKTKVHGTEICWPIPENAFNQIMPFRDSKGEYCLDCEEKFNPRRKRLNWNTARKHTYMWKSINKFFRGIGFKGMYAFYELRYASCQETYKKYGEEMERAKHGHSIRTAQMSYYNKNDHSLSL